MASFGVKREPLVVGLPVNVSFVRTGSSTPGGVAKPNSSTCDINIDQPLHIEDEERAVL